MPRTEPLPSPLDTRPFSVHEGRAAGLSASRLRAHDLTSPFVGVRAPTPPDAPVPLALAYAAKLSDGEFFSHATAALLHGIWLPMPLERDPELHVSVVKPKRAPRDTGVRGHHLIHRPGLVWSVHGLPTSNPVETWCQLGTQLTVDDLVVAGDALLAKGRPEPELMLRRLVHAATNPARPAHRRLLAASRALRVGVRSPWETRTRLLLIDGGLPEPELNWALSDSSGRVVAECDIAYPDAKVAIEYEGDHHRTDPVQWRHDLVRYERVSDLGWRAVRVSQDDIRLRPQETVQRVRTLLRSRLAA